MNWKLGEYDGLMHISDWMPTILSLVQERDWHEKPVEPVSLPKDLDGIDMSQALKTGAASHRTSVLPQVDIFMNATTYRKGW